ncbi:MAG TPA: hypothetical protein VFI38_19300 [Candidatus Acidoferrum sp.]|nr:hypothetical protein [Candidatus Acidoferrum sp.]
MTVAAWDPQFPITSWQIMLAGGGLLFIAGLLTGLQRKNRVALQRSPLTDELMIYLSRIAEAMERQAERPSGQQIAEMIERRIAQQQRNSEASAAAAGAGATPKTRTVAFSMFGREYPEKG